MKLIPQWLQRPFEEALTPIARGLISQGIHPNTLTTIGFLVVAVSAIAFGAGLIRWGGFFLLLSGAFDVLDGKVARGGGLMTRFGAFYDSTLDRLGEAALFTGIAVFCVRGGVRDDLVVWGVAASMTAMAAALIVSYARARAEGLMLECRVGLVQRAERIIGLGVPALFLGGGPDGLYLFGVVAALAALSLFTVFQRIHHVRKLARAVVPERSSVDAVPAMADAEEGRRRE